MLSNTTKLLLLTASLIISCGKKQGPTYTTRTNSSDANKAGYVSKSDLDSVFAGRESNSEIDVTGNDMERASLALTSGVGQAFNDVNMNVSDEEVGDIVSLLLTVFVSITTGDIGSLMGVLNEVIGLVVNIIGGGNPAFALQNSTGDIIGDVVGALIQSLPAVLSGDIDAFVSVMIDFISNLIGGLAAS